MWRSEYLSSLRERSQSCMKKGRVISAQQPQTGDIVLIKEDLPRGCWKISRIDGLIQSNDGKVRSAKVCLSSGRVLRRPLNLLVPIETSQSTEVQQNEKLPLSDNTKISQRSTRSAALDATAKIRQIAQIEQKQY